MKYGIHIQSKLVNLLKNFYKVYLTYACKNKSKNLYKSFACSLIKHLNNFGLYFTLYHGNSHKVGRWSGKVLIITTKTEMLD